MSSGCAEIGSASEGQPLTLRIVICPEASSAQNSIAAVSAQGRTVCVLMRRLNSSCRRSIALVVRADFHWLFGSRVKVNRFSPASSRLVATAAHQPPLTQEALAPRRNLLRALGIDHVVVIGRNLVMQALRRVGEQIAMLVHRAALRRHRWPQRAQRLLQTGPAVDNR